jgi:tetratricopeptide (TPR) repeat protein
MDPKLLLILAAVVCAGFFVDWRTLFAKLPKDRIQQLKGRVSLSKVKILMPSPTFSFASVRDFFSSLPARFHESRHREDPFQHIDAMPVHHEPPAKPRPETPEEKAFRTAELFYNRGDIAAAEAAYVALAAENPKAHAVYARLAEIYLEHQNILDDAQSAIDQALRVDPQNGDYRYISGRILYARDRFTDAVRELEVAVHEDEMDDQRLATLGQAYMALRQYAKAESCFKKALSLQPNNMNHKDDLSRALEKKEAHRTMIRK